MKEVLRRVREALKGLSRRFGILSLPVFFLALVFIDGAFRWVYAGAGSTRLLNAKTMLFTCSWALLVTALTGLMPRLGRRIAMGALGVFFGFLVILHGVMYNVFGHFFSFADMNFAGDGAKFFSWTYFQLPKKLYFFVLLFLLMVGAAMVLASGPRAQGKRLWVQRGCMALIAPVCIAAILLTHQKLMPRADVLTWDNRFDPNSDTEVYREFTDANRSMKLTGLYQYTARNFAVSFGIGTNARSAQELTDIFESRAQPAANEFSGSLKGKNLILVMLESIDTWLARPEYMPRFCEVIDGGVEFTDFYTPLFLSAGTFNTEIISQTGLVPPAAGMASSGYSTNAFPLSLASLFGDEGYNVNSFHPASPGIYSRGTVHTNLGFEKYHSYVDMGMDEYQLDSQMLRAFGDMTEGDSFYSYIITYSGHGPYTEEMGVIAGPHLEAAREAVNKSGITDTPENMEEYTRAVAHAMETDRFIGGLMDRLEEEGLLEDTVVLFYADHYGKYMSDKEFLNRLKGVEPGTPELYRTPCVLAGGGLKAAKVDKPASSLDIVPTVVDLYGLDAPMNYYAGESMFSPGEGLVPFPNNGWYDGDTYYSGEGGVQQSQRTAELKQRIEASMEAVRTDYFREWEK